MYPLTLSHATAMNAIAAFVTSHGFGHATRTTAILEALQERYPNLKVRLFTTVPRTIFAETLDDFSYHPIDTDVGLVQRNGLDVDLAATDQRLATFLGTAQQQTDELAELVAGCDMVLADISPLAGLVARALGIPSVLVENFTWDWLYGPYCETVPRFQRHIEQLAELYGHFTLHIRVEPHCGEDEGSLLCPPVCRPCRTSPQLLRSQLHTGNRKVILITFGGFSPGSWDISLLQAWPEYFFVIAGHHHSARPMDNCLLIAATDGYYHPDLIAAADLVVCKCGYSTFAECYQAGTRPLFLQRPTFRESAVLAEFATTRLDGVELRPQEFHSGSWLNHLPALLDRPPPVVANATGLAPLVHHLVKLMEP